MVFLQGKGEPARGGERTGRDAGDDLAGCDVVGDDGVRPDGGPGPDGDPAEDHGALAEEHVVADGDGPGALGPGSIPPGMVGTRHEHPVGKDAPGPDRHGVVGVQVDIVTEVGAIADDERAAALLDLEPGAAVHRDTRSDVDAVNAAQLPRGDDDTAGAETTEGPGIESA